MKVGDDTTLRQLAQQFKAGFIDLERGKHLRLATKDGFDELGSKNCKPSGKGGESANAASKSTKTR